MADASSRTEPAAELLSVDSIEVIYGGNILAVADVSLHVGQGEIVTLLGSNGAGKSTTLKAISGLIHTDRAQISRGSIRFDGSDVTDEAANLKAKRGIVHVLEGRRVFTHLTVEENLRSGTFVRRRSRRDTAADIEEIYTWFPRLKVKLKTRAGLLFGR
jgi:branched-chain amino acid transport system ATP-binding protein